MHSPSRRSFLKSIVNGAASTAVLGSTKLFPSPKAASSTPPNVVIFVADDLGWNDVGYHGSEIETPNIDKLAAEGVELDRFYSFPICSPTRVGLMTGRSPVRLGLTDLVKSGTPGPALDEPFLPTFLKAAGYQTWMTGKWHLGDYGDYLPNSRGVDHFYGHLGGEVHYKTHKSGGELDWQRNSVTIEEQGYSTYLLRDEAIQLITSRDDSKPFFLYFPFNAPHTPLVAPNDLNEKYNWIEDENRSIFAAMVDGMDAAIGEIIATLELEGIRDNTLILFFSDNGADSTDGGGSNTPLRGDKGKIFEGGIRTPACINWPGLLPAGQACRQVISVMDIFPTLAAALELEPNNTKPFDGANRWPQIKDADTTVPPDGLVITGPNPDLTSAAFTDDWKLVKTQNQIQLFNIDQDPTESTNLSAANPDVVQHLSNQIQQMLQTNTRIDEKSNFPDIFSIEQNYPNPFNATTQINYSIKSKTQVRLSIFNIRGQEVARLVDRRHTPGSYSATFNAGPMSSGVYFYRLQAGDFVVTKKMLLAR
jgi:arylsulfatase B